MFLDLPTIPFSVYYEDYNKTVNVVASCNKNDWKSKTLTFTSAEGLDYELIFLIINSINFLSSFNRYLFSSIRFQFKDPYSLNISMQLLNLRIIKIHFVFYI
jgi:hypothetical protein